MPTPGARSSLKVWILRQLSPAPTSFSFEHAISHAAQPVQRSRFNVKIAWLTLQAHGGNLDGRLLNCEWIRSFVFGVRR